MSSVRRTWMVGLSLALSFVLSASLFAADALEAVKVKAGKVTGVVCDSAGKAMKDVALRLMTGDKEVRLVKSDETGAYNLGELAEGRYELYVGAEKPLTLAASADGKTTTLRIILPLTSGHGQSEILGLSTWAVIGGGVVVTAAVVTPIVVNNSGGDSGSVSGRLR